MSWIDDFKIALIEENETKLLSLIDTMPTFDDPDEIRTAMHLIDQARSLVEKRKRRLAEEMRQLETSKKFLTSSEEEAPDRRLDITS